MSRFGQFVMGPAGAGKSTYCHFMAEHMEITHKKRCRIVNLDPALHENVETTTMNKQDTDGQLNPDGTATCSSNKNPSPGGYDYDIDIRDLITSDDIQEELEFGPNGGLVYAMEYFGEHLNTWFREQIEEYQTDSEYFLFDCPGQIELYVHHPVMRSVVEFLQNDLQIRMCGIFLLDAATVVNEHSCASKFLSGSLMALNAMLHLQLPHLNLLTKVDLLVTNNLVGGGAGASRSADDGDDGKMSKKTTLDKNYRQEDDFTDPIQQLHHQEKTGDEQEDEFQRKMQNAVADRFLDLCQPSDLLPELNQTMHPRFKQLNAAIVELLEQYQMVSYSTLSAKYDEESLNEISHRVNDLLQYYEEQEVDDKGYDRAMERINEGNNEDMEEYGGDHYFAEQGGNDCSYENVDRDFQKTMENMSLDDVDLEKFGLLGA
ncbi:unnamed protein product [Amoebophrya sp. A120]|nr:unnamed protein product [Amoebophrya sp. A120]|eukprot:GSA120T00013416001.1